MKSHLPLALFLIAGPFSLGAHAAQRHPARRAPYHRPPAHRPASAAPVPAPPPAAAGPTGSGRFQPTNVFAVDRAQALMPDALVVGIGDVPILGLVGMNPDVGVEAGLGVAPNAEVDLLGSLSLTGIGGGFAVPFAAGAQGKYIFASNDTLGVGLLGNVALSKPVDTLSTSLGLGLPVSFWIGHTGAFDVEPGVQFTAAGNANNTVFGVGLAFEKVLNDRVRLMLRDDVAFPNNQFANTYEGGVRLSLTPNTTVDVSLLDGQLLLGGAGTPAGAANVTLVNMTAYFGAYTQDVVHAFGF